MKVCYTDGATSNNGKENAVGGAAWVIVEKDQIIEQGSIHIPNATSNISELTALIEGCKAAQRNADFMEAIIVYSDSAYCVNCYKQRWWEKWMMNNWRTVNKQPVANKELWLQLIPFFKDVCFTFEKVRGHSGVDWNEYVDKIAVAAKEIEG